MTTKEVSEITQVPCSTIRKYAPELDGLPVGGNIGYVFPKDAPQRLRAILRKKRGGAQWRIFQRRKEAFIV